MEDAVVSVEGLTHHYGTLRAVNNISFSVSCAIKLLSTSRKLKWPRRVPPSAKQVHHSLDQAIRLILGEEARGYLPTPSDETGE